MEVYILLHNWNTPDNEGAEVLGVFKSLQKAQAAMMRSAYEIEMEYDTCFFDPDMTWKEPMSVHFGHDPMTGELGTFYAWDIVKQNVI